MTKCLFNRTTGQIYAFAGPDQNIDAVASNYTDVDMIDTDYRVTRVKPITPIQVNIVTRQVEEIS
jgi:hypothetical protein